MAVESAQYCPHCGAGDQSGTYCMECGEALESAPDEEQDPGNPPDGKNGISGHAHLFGDVYWRKQSWAEAIWILVLPFLFLSRAEFVDVFEAQLQWLAEIDSDIVLWILRNYTSIPVILITFWAASKLRLDPDPVDEE